MTIYPKMRRGTLTTDSWAGPFAWPVDVLGETPKLYRVRMRGKTCLPRGWVKKGVVVMVPKHAVTFAAVPRG